MQSVSMLMLCMEMPEFEGRGVERGGGMRWDGRRRGRMFTDTQHPPFLEGGRGAVGVVVRDLYRSGAFSHNY